MRAQILAILVMLGPAAGPLTAVDAVPPAAPSTTPFTSDRPGRVVVAAAVGGRPYRFLVDTGSSHTAVAVRLASEVGARPVARTQLGAAGGSIECLVVALPAVSLGGAAMAEGLEATVLPDGVTLATMPAGVDGVLGQDFLSRFVYTIDYRRSRLTWHEAGYVAPGDRLTLIAGQDRWLVELPQPPSPSVRRFVPDSGADALVLYGEGRARDLGAEWLAGSATLDSLTGARDDVRVAAVQGLKVGTAILGRQLAAVVPSTPATDDPDGLLPLHLFASVFISARERTLVVQPR